MKINNQGNSSAQIHNSGDNHKVTNRSVSQGTAPAAPKGAASGHDRISLTESATRLQALTDHVKTLPVVDIPEVEAVQRTLATTGVQIRPERAADNLLDQEKAFAMMEMQD